MRDLMLEVAARPSARRVVSALGVHVPVGLKRAEGARREQALADQRVVVGGGAELGKLLAQALVPAGADVVLSDSAIEQSFLRLGEAYGRLARFHDGEGLNEMSSALVFDATGLCRPDDLRQLYDFFHPRLSTLARNGRVVVLGRAPESMSGAAAVATQTALDGFVRSLAKEVGARGATAQLLIVQRGAEARAIAPLRFLLSRRSCFVSGQPIRVSTLSVGDAESNGRRALEGKVALVTGAARGIGRATARLLAAEGAHVVCLDRPEDDGPTSRIAREVGGSVALYDVCDSATPDALVAQLMAEHGGVDVVVHNAGVTRDKTLGRMGESLWDLTLGVNLEAVVRITEALGDGCLRNNGRVICLSSVAGIAGNRGQTNYAASKAGVSGYVRALAPELASRGVTVNAVAPGFIETRLTDQMPVMIREAGRRLNGLGQGGQPQDVAEVITFLASPGAIGISGSVIRVCGAALIGA